MKRERNRVGRVKIHFAHQRKYALLTRSALCYLIKMEANSGATMLLRYCNLIDIEKWALVALKPGKLLPVIHCIGPIDYQIARKTCCSFSNPK